MDKVITRILDKDKDILVLPCIKDESSEIKVDIVKNSNLPLSAKEVICFPFDWRFEDVVINCLAKKYAVNIENYPEVDEDEERFLIGPEACKNAIASIECPYLTKALAVLKEKYDFRLKDLVAIYLLNMDDTEDNNQKFIALSKKKIYVRHKSNEIERFSYDNLVFSRKGIQSREIIIENLKENRKVAGKTSKRWKEDKDRDLEELHSLINYPFSNEFVKFVHEFQLLRSSTLKGIDRNHPLIGKSQDVKTRYFEFLIDCTSSSGMVSAKELLKLEYLARELRIGDNVLLAGLERNLRKKKDDRTITKDFNDLWGNILTEELRYVLYLDILDLIINDKGEAKNENLEELIMDNVGEKFVKAYIEFTKYKKLAEEKLLQALINVEYSAVNLPNIYEIEKYREALNGQILAIGVATNGKKYF